MAASASPRYRLAAAFLGLALAVTACGSGDAEPTDAGGVTPTEDAPGPPGFTPPEFVEPTSTSTEAEGRPAHAEGVQEPLTWWGSEGEFQAGGGQFEPEYLPRAFTCDGPGNTPHVAWRAVPEGTVSIALVLVDDETGLLHWQVTGLDPATEGFQAGDDFPAAATQGRNGVTGEGYAPPCAEPGVEHEYTMTVLALSADPGPQDTDDAQAVLAAFESAALASVEIEIVVVTQAEDDDEATPAG